MAVSKEKQPRQRAVRLTSEAAAMLSAKLGEVWIARNPGKRLTREARAELMGVSPVTADRILNGERVDKSSILIAFGQLGLEFDDSHWIHARETAAIGTDSVDRPSPVDARKRRPLGLYLLGGGAVLAVGCSLLAWPKLLPTQDVRRENEFHQHLDEGFKAYHRGTYALASYHIDRAIEMSHDRNASDVIDALRLKGEMHVKDGEYAKALSCFEDCLTFMRRTDTYRGDDVVFELIGNTQVQLGRFDEARSAYQESLKRARARNDIPEIGAALRGLGTVAGKQGDTLLAKALYREAISALSKGSEPAMVCDIEARLALVMSDEGGHQRALETLQKCLGYWKQEKHARWIATTEYQIGTVYCSKGDWAAGRAYLKSARQGYESVNDALLQRTSR